MKSNITTDHGLIVSVISIVYQDDSQTFFISIEIPDSVEPAFVMTWTIGFALYVPSFVTSFEKFAVFPWRYSWERFLYLQWGEVIIISISIHSTNESSFPKEGTVIDVTVASYLLTVPQTLISKSHSIPWVFFLRSSILAMRSLWVAPCTNRRRVIVFGLYFLSMIEPPSARDDIDDVMLATMSCTFPFCTATQTSAFWSWYVSLPISRTLKGFHWKSYITLQ